MKPRKFKRTESLTVLSGGVKVGELHKPEGKGLYFVYDPGWLAAGFNLSPLTMSFDDKPQLARDPDLFGGLHGPFADSLPDGWGLLLMDRFFNSTFGDGTAYTVTALDRLAYMGDRGMGAFDYQPSTETETLSGDVSLSQLFEASIDVQQGETCDVLAHLRLAGGSSGGARPKAIVALSPDRLQATSAFGPVPQGYEHCIVKFRALNESVETGAIEFAYAEMARDAGVQMADSSLLGLHLPDGSLERCFATRRFDRHGHEKIHMITVSALMYANFRAPSMEYPNLLKLTQMLTKNSADVERMARLMIFNALSHNHDDHVKNFAFLCSRPEKAGAKAVWTLAPAYDVTFSNALGEHTTGFGGPSTGRPTRQRIREICKEYRYLRADDYIDQTLEALRDWQNVFDRLSIAHKAGSGIFNVLDRLHEDFEKS